MLAARAATDRQAPGPSLAAFLQNANRHFNGRPPIKIVPYPTDNEAICALAQGKADAAFDDTPTVTYAAAHNKALVEGVQLRSAIPIGIALRKADPRIPKGRSGHGSRRHDADDLVTVEPAPVRPQAMTTRPFPPTRGQVPRKDA